MDAVRVTLLYTQEEYARGMRFYLRKTGIISALTMVLFVVILALVGVLIWLRGMTLLNTALVVLLVMSLLMGLYLYIVQPAHVFKKTARLGQIHYFTFTSEDIGVQNEEMAGVIPWNYKAFWSTPEFYFLIQDRYDYLMLPRRAFVCQTDMECFEAMVKQAAPDIKCRRYR